MKSLFILALGVSLVLACGNEKESTEPSLCESTEDCGETMVCLAGECASTKGSDIYTDPASAVTPTKVGAELRAIEEKRQKRRDELLEGL